tara:strand:+ start:2349 stop:2501 length:153 start_codon:yes stop_codon:yes gene_type:complete
MQYYRAKFTRVGSPYAFDLYDLKTDDENEIIEKLESEGHEVLEVYDIKKQ